MATTQKVILYVCVSGGYLAHHHLTLLRRAAALADVHVAVPDVVDSSAIRDLGCTLHEIGLSRKSSNPLRIAGEAAELRTLCGRIKPDLVNAITLKSFLVAALAGCGASRPPLIGTITGLGYLFAGNGPRQVTLRFLTSAALRRVLRKTPHHLLFSNKDDVEEFVRRKIIARNAASIVPVPGVNLDEFSATPEPNEGFRVVLPARMILEKGILDFIKAAELLRNRGISASFILAGTPDPGNPSSLSAESLESAHRAGIVEWVGRIENMPGLLASCHAVCLPSYYREGFPRVLAEAFACGRPVVTTDTPGCRDAVEGKETGLLVPPRDAEALAAAILTLMEKPEERREMGAAGRILAERMYDEKKITEAVIGTYREFL